MPRRPVSYITPENAHHLELVSVLGRGTTYAVRYPDMNTITTISIGGIWNYDARQLSTPPQWIPLTENERFRKGGFNYASADGSTVAIFERDNDKPDELFIEAYQQVIMRLTFLPDERVSHVAFNDNGSRMAVAGTMRLRSPWDYGPTTISVWNVRTGERITTLNYDDLVRDMVLSPDDRYLIVYASSFYIGTGSIKLYDVNTERVLLSISNDHWREVTGAAFSPDSQQVVLVYADGRLQIFETLTGDLIEETHGYPGYAVDATFTEDTIMTTNDEEAVFVWNIHTFEDVAQYPGCTLVAYHETRDIALCRRGGFLGQRTVLLHLTTGEEIAPVPVGPLDDEQPMVLAAAFHQEGDQMTVIDSQGHIQIHDTATGNAIHTLVGEGSWDYTLAVQYTQDGRYLAAGAAGTVWDLRDHTVIVQPQIEPSWHSNLSISEAGDWYALPWDACHARNSLGNYTSGNIR